jgi:phospholipase C
MSTQIAMGSIKHLFVLMLENRSFDHMLGFSGITGRDAATGQPTTINGLLGAESNSYNGATYPVTHPADFAMTVDPAHEFLNVLRQLCGPIATYSPGGAYPAIDCSGFVAEYVASGGHDNPAEIMKCYEPGQLPVLNALAREFAVCDNWYSSLPGPTWPNRFFVHAASSGGLDHSPTSSEIAQWELLSGFDFSRGTIFDSLNSLGSGGSWRIYAGGAFPNVAALQGIHNFQINDFADFAADVAGSAYNYSYTFIEPNYGDVVFNTFRGGNSQHPLDDVTHGEQLIKAVYEAVRNSRIWENSLLIVTWDEHGGFYDHVVPPPAVPPGDKIVTPGANQYGFTFAQYGPRVPAVIVSPRIPKNLIDHRRYDHSCVPATIEALFGLGALTQRDATANNVAPLASLTSPRFDTPTTLPSPVIQTEAESTMLAPVGASPTDSIDQGNLPGFLHAALRSDLALSRPEQRPAILAQFQTIKTREQAKGYLDQVRVKVQAGRAATRQRAMGHSS